MTFFETAAMPTVPNTGTTVQVVGAFSLQKNLWSMSVRSQLRGYYDVCLTSRHTPVICSDDT